MWRIEKRRTGQRLASLKAVVISSLFGVCALLSLIGWQLYWCLHCWSTVLTKRYKLDIQVDIAVLLQETLIYLVPHYNTHYRRKKLLLTGPLIWLVFHPCWRICCVSICCGFWFSSYVENSARWPRTSRARPEERTSGSPPRATIPIGRRGPRGQSRALTGKSRRRLHVLRWID